MLCPAGFFPRNQTTPRRKLEMSIRYNFRQRFEGMLKFLLIISMCTEISEGVMKLLINDRRIIILKFCQRSLQKILILELMGYTEISVKDAWVVSILKSLINDRRVHFTLLKSFWSRVYWNVHQIFLGRLKILGYTEISIDDSRVYWNFRQKFRRYTENSEGILKFLIRVLTFL